MLKNPCDFLINRISVIVQRRRYKGRRKGWKSSEIRIEGRGIDSWKRSLHFVRSVHIESKSRRTIKADVSIWTCRDFLFFPLFSAFILPLPLFLWFHSPLPYSLLPSLFFFTFPRSVLPSQDILLGSIFLGLRSSLHASPPSLASDPFPRASALPYRARTEDYSFIHLPR